jgi:hypothetical protein
MSVMSASVVSSSEATDAAFCRAMRDDDGAGGARLLDDLPDGPLERRRAIWAPTFSSPSSL